MPTIAENLFWGTYSWPEGGDEWSKDWGNATTQWHATILPRIRRFFPANRVLEIAPGFGRWSEFLIKDSIDYVGVDLNPQCTEACQKRFANILKAKFVTNDGTSLAAIDDSSIDFTFSFDSLVHAEIDVLAAYLQELAKKLAPDGIAFIHHSNLGEYNGLGLRIAKSLYDLPQPWPVAPILRRLQLGEWDHWRASSVTANAVAQAAARNGLVCIRQEIVNCGLHNMRLIDCMSTFTRAGSCWESPPKIVRNPHFMSEARSARSISMLE